MARRRKKARIPKTLLNFAIISGLATLILHLINRNLRIAALGEIAGYVGTAFAISLLIILGIWLVDQVNKK